MRRKTLIVIASAIFACMFSFFVGCAAEVSTEERSFELEENASVVWLDRYDETDVALKKGDASKLMWSSADEKVVTAEKGRLIAQGKGETFVTVSDGKFDQTITVKVRDSGVKPVIGFAEFDAFLNVETEIPGKVNYNGKIYEPSLDYTVEIADESVAVFSEGKIKGLKIGETSAELSASYKGLTLSETVTVSVKPVLYVAFSEDSLDLYNVDGKLGSAVLEAEVFRLGKKIENAEVVYTVTEGEEFVALESGKISAVKEGKSVVEASYSKDGDKATDALEITVHPNWIAGAFENRSTEAITFEAETGEIGGRTGDILKYRAGADVTGENCWEHHITEKSSGKSVLDLYKEGKKYFAYDLYYTSNQNLMVGCGAYTSWIQAGDYFRKDYLTILSDGEVINRLGKNPLDHGRLRFGSALAARYGTVLVFLLFCKRSRDVSVHNERALLSGRFFYAR